MQPNNHYEHHYKKKKPPNNSNGNNNEQYLDIEMQLNNHHHHHCNNKQKRKNKAPNHNGNNKQKKKKKPPNNNQNQTTIMGLCGIWDSYCTDYSKSTDNDEMIHYSMLMKLNVELDETSDKTSYAFHGKSEKSHFPFTLKGTAYKTNDDQYMLEYQIQNQSKKASYNVKCIFDGDSKLINGEWYNPDYQQAFGYMAAFKSGYHLSKREKKQLSTTFKSLKRAKLTHKENIQKRIKTQSCIINHENNVNHIDCDLMAFVYDTSSSDSDIINMDNNENESNNFKEVRYDLLDPKPNCNGNIWLFNRSKQLQKFKQIVSDYCQNENVSRIALANENIRRYKVNNYDKIINDFVNQNGESNELPLLKILDHDNNIMNMRINKVLSTYEINENNETRIVNLHRTLGVQALIDIPKHTVICQYIGYEFTPDEYDKFLNESHDSSNHVGYSIEELFEYPLHDGRFRRANKKLLSDLFGTDKKKLTIDPRALGLGSGISKNNVLAYINDARKDIKMKKMTDDDLQFYNCEFVGARISGWPSLFVITNKDIKKGDALWSYYGPKYSDLIKQSQKNRRK